MPQVILIRPGCTDFDEQHRIQGALELPLNERGQQQVHDLVETLRDFPLEAIYTSPGEPARSTATILGDALGVSVKVLEGLENLDQGLWEGLQVDEIRHKYPKVFRQWLECPETICPPQGETITDALGRVGKTLRKPLKRKDCFAVVLSEPLATLVSCLLQHRRPEVPDPPYDGVHAARVEMIQMDAQPAFALHGDEPDAEPVPAVRALARGEDSR